MRKTKTEVENLKQRIRVVRDNFRANPEIRWMPIFRRDNPTLKPSKIKNVYYLQSTDERITGLLEKHWEKYKPTQN